VILRLLGTFSAPGFDPTALFPNASKSAGIVTIRIYYEGSDKQFRIQVYPYFEHKSGLKLQMYPKQVRIFYYEREAAKRRRRMWKPISGKSFVTITLEKWNGPTTRSACDRLNRGRCADKTQHLCRTAL
jgi:hypothetical protein